jgi:hypothetical protein
VIGEIKHLASLASRKSFVPVPDHEMTDEYGVLMEQEMAGKNQSSCRISRPTATFTTTNLTWITWELNPYLHSEL